jgi:ABC-2 type transport system ATP-binding protein
VNLSDSFASAGRPSAITVDHLTKRYQAITAVDDISFEVPEGQLLALLGPNGAGKSTTIDTILGLTRPDAGRVSVFGRTPTDAVAAGSIGGMLQTGTLIEYLRVRELITMVASLYPHPLPTDEVMELTGTAAFGDRQTNKLSGGQVQRVRFAMALVADADLLLLDEPTSALDVEGRREFWASVRAVAARGKTVLFATHYLEEADAYADRIVLLAKGRIVADGSTTEIKAMVGNRTIRATLPGADLSELTALRGVTAAERQGDTVTLTCRDSDAALRSLLDRFSLAHDIEVRGAGIEEAFVALTADQDNYMTTSGGTNR